MAAIDVGMDMVRGLLMLRPGLSPLPLLKPMLDTLEVMEAMVATAVDMEDMVVMAMDMDTARGPLMLKLDMDMVDIEEDIAVDMADTVAVEDMDMARGLLKLRLDTLEVMVDMVDMVVMAVDMADMVDIVEDITVNFYLFVMFHLSLILLIGHKTKNMNKL